MCGLRAKEVVQVVMLVSERVCGDAWVAWVGRSSCGEDLECSIVVSYVDVSSDWEFDVMARFQVVEIVE
jgi:hypothetical protein